MNKIPAGYFLLLAFVFQFSLLYAQKRWNGSMNNNWDNALNWQPAGLPGVSDAVILDNAVLNQDYKVILPDSSVSIQSLVIGPAIGNEIELILPFSNMASPALVVEAGGDAIIIKNGGILKNSSGLNNGQSIRVNGLIRILNGGAYIHNTRSSHATEIVAKLSADADTEKGIFEFDVPGGAYPVSMSNRTYGKLVLSANASGGSQTYNASGNNTLTINGDFQINDGVRLNVDFAGDFIIKGDFIQNGGTFNIASQPNNNTIQLKGNIDQALNAMITESSSGLPVLELNGNTSQVAALQGSLTNQVSMRINNPGGVILGHQLLLPYNLELQKGKIKTTHTCLLILSDSSQVTGASVSSFIDGPLKKFSVGDFEFPVGKQGDYAPVRIKGSPGTAKDECTVEYFLANPLMQFGAAFELPVIRRLSSLEYWMINRSGGTSLGKLTLAVNTYSNATAIDKLVVAHWDHEAGIWRSQGNDVNTGISTGTITSKESIVSGAFTLASTTELMNPLTVTNPVFHATRQQDEIQFNWNVEKNLAARYFEVETSWDGKKFKPARRLVAETGCTEYALRLPDDMDGRKTFYRLKVSMIDGTFFYSNIVLLPGVKEQVEFSMTMPAVVKNTARLVIQSAVNESVLLTITDMNGRLVLKMSGTLFPGNNLININLDGLSCGMYMIRVNDKLYPEGIVRFIKE